MLKPILIAAALLTPAVAGAEPRGWLVGDSYHISHADLDLASLPGRAALLRRVERAAGRLCRQPTGGEQRACVAATLAKSGPLVRQALAERDGGARLAAR